MIELIENILLLLSGIFLIIALVMFFVWEIPKGIKTIRSNTAKEILSAAKTQKKAQAIIKNFATQTSDAGEKMKTISMPELTFYQSAGFEVKQQQKIEVHVKYADIIENVRGTFIESEDKNKVNGILHLGGDNLVFG